MRKILTLLCILCMALSQLHAQTKTVAGKVTDDKGTPISGVTITELGANKKVLTAAVTNEMGVFTIKISEKTTALQFTSVGYYEQVLPASSIKTGTLEIKLSSKVDNLAEVIVTTAGGLKTRKKDIGTASTQVNAQELTAGKATTITGGLQGKVAGLNVSATSGGVNPSFRVVLRGQRSLTGNNQALVVLDNVIVPSEMLGNLNPEDVEDVVVLNGAGAAALYGSDASNGALLITTKKGSKGKFSAKVSNTVTFEQVAFYPKLQNRFGSGSTADIYVYDPIENQQYGPAFDGSLRLIGQPLADGSQETVRYSPNNSKNDFWERGLYNQTDFQLSSGDDRGTTFISGQYMTGKGTTPGDKFNRATVRFNGTRTMAKNLTVSYNTSYTQNRYDISSRTGTIYNNLMQTPAQIVVTNYKDWQNGKFSTLDGYYNPYYTNPYFIAGAYRQKTRNDYLTGSAELKYTPLSWLDFTYRIGITTRNNTYKSYNDNYVMTAFTKAQGGGSAKTSDVVGAVTDYSFYSTRITSDFFVGVKKRVNDFNFRFTAAASVRQDQSKVLSATINGLVVSGLFNLNNSIAPPTASESNYLARQLGVFGDLNIGYKDFLNVHMTGRNDWVSTLAPENRSFFYPAVDVAITPMDLFPALKEIKAISSLKLRGGWSKVGQVNVGSNFGAYALQSTFSQTSGYPYTSGGFSLDNKLVALGLKPEITKGWEAGFDIGLLRNRATFNFTWYSTQTSNQTVTTGISSATGYSSYLVNAGRTSSSGLEMTANVAAIRNRDWDLTIGGNFTYVIANKVLEISSDVSRISLGNGSYAVAGQPFPVVMGITYKRDPQGRVIVNPLSGYPSLTDTISVLGSAVPKHILGLNFNLRYKQFTLGAVAEYRGGNVTYMPSTTSFDFSGGGINTVAYNRERFVFPNSSIPDPNKPGEYLANNNITIRDGNYAFWSGSMRTGAAENYVYSGAFWKIREVSLSYEVPQKVLSHLKFIKKAVISAQGRNLFIFVPKTNVYTDPEFSDNGSGNGIGVGGVTNAPPSRYYGATISLTF